jgi:N-methylhydantoinase B/oxoprolinase/acetone carboxylase alpha subunit
MDLLDWFYGRPRKPTTPSGWSVLAWGAIVLLAGFGAVALYVAGKLPAAEAADAVMLRSGAYKAFGIAGAIFVVKWFVGRLTGD